MNDFASSPELILLPAVDVAGGKAVRLTQGEAGTETNYGDPVDAALDFARQGAEWIHLVDLDAAFGRGSNAQRARARSSSRSAASSVELSGGIRDDASLEAALESGATRINLGTAALENPEWAADVIGRYGDAIAVGLDVRGTTLAARGWTQEGGDLWAVLRAPRGGRLQPLRRHRRDQGRHAAGPEPRTAARGHRRARRSPSSRPAASRTSTTSPRCATSCRTASRARSSARRSTRARSRSPRRWMSPETDPRPPTTPPAFRGRGAASSRTRTRATTARPTRRCSRR